MRALDCNTQGEAAATSTAASPCTAMCAAFFAFKAYCGPMYGAFFAFQEVKGP